MNSPRAGLLVTSALSAALLAPAQVRADEIPSYLSPTPAPMGIGNSCGENAMSGSITEVVGRATHMLGEERVKAGLALPLNIETRIGMLHALTIAAKREAAPDSGEAKALDDLADRLHSVQTTLAMEESYCEAQRAAEYEREHPAGVVYSAIEEAHKASVIAQQTGQPVTVKQPNGETVVAMSSPFWLAGTSREGK